MEIVMTQEQKAQAYDEALERAKTILKRGYYISGDIEVIFPELAESENEKIKKEIHIYLDWLDGRKDYAPKGEYSIRDMIAWLEKQGEQKPAWSEEDEKFLTEIVNYVRCDNCLLHPEKDMISWLKQLKERMV